MILKKNYKKIINVKKGKNLKVQDIECLSTVSNSQTLSLNFHLLTRKLKNNNIL